LKNMSDLTKSVLKLVGNKVTLLLKQTWQTQKKPIGISLLSFILWYRFKRAAIKNIQRTLGRGHGREKKKHGDIDVVFLKRLLDVLRTGMPSIWCRETLFASLLASVLLIRTFMTLYINDIIGTFVHHLTSRDSRGCMSILFIFYLWEYRCLYLMHF